jgi:lipopolysaccharide export system protein LptC
MVTQTQIPQGRVRFAGLPTSGDRAKAFRRATRHSALVGLLRRLFPLAALAIAGLYLLPNNLTVETEIGTATVDDIDIDSGGLKMINPRIKRVDEKFGTYDIRADNATQHVDNTDMITLNTIAADLVSKSGDTTTFSAPSGLFHRKKEEMTFNNGVTISGNGGFTGKLKSATAFFQNKKVISTDPVDLGYHSSRIKADRMTFYSGESRAIFEGRVRVHLERKPEDGQK